MEHATIILVIFAVTYIAIAIGRVGITTPEQKAQAIRAWEGYLRGAPANDPQLPAIRVELARLKK